MNVFEFHKISGKYVFFNETLHMCSLQYEDVHEGG